MKIRALAILNIFLILLASGCTTANKPATHAEARIVTRITPPAVVVSSHHPFYAQTASRQSRSPMAYAKSRSSITEPLTGVLTQMGISLR